MKIRVALIGTGKVAMMNHAPGIRLCPQAELVALCDSDPATLAEASRQTGITAAFSDFRELLSQAPIDAVIISTPNITHHPIAMAAIAAGKHVQCEKPLGLDTAQTREMYEAAERAGVRHMTAFTYRFVPAMRYMKHLLDAGAVGRPYHFRATRFQDFGSLFLAWRQQKAMAGSGELGDMLSHRIDFGHFLVGPMTRLIANMKRFLDVRVDRQGQSHPSDVEDWVALMTEFQNGATGLLESTKMATGHGGIGRGQDRCEVNGSEGTVIYELSHPHQVIVGKTGGRGLETLALPEEFLKVPGSPRDPHAGDPLQSFRYDQDFEFIQAILEQRPCRPSFLDGMRVQTVLDAALRSYEDGCWVELPDVMT